jgi:hypothetical protein
MRHKVGFLYIFSQSSLGKEAQHDCKLGLD